MRFVEGLAAALRIFGVGRTRYTVSLVSGHGLEFKGTSGILIRQNCRLAFSGILSENLVRSASVLVLGETFSEREEVSRNADGLEERAVLVLFLIELLGAQQRR